MIWSLGGNYFHALSSSDLFLKPDNNYSAGLGFLLSLMRGERRINKNEAKYFVFVLWQVYQKLLLLLEESFDFTIIHCHFSNLRHCYSIHTLLYKIHGHVDECGWQMYCIYNILYRKNQAPVLLIDNNSKRLEFTTSTITVHDIKLRWAFSTKMVPVLVQSQSLTYNSNC